MRLGRQQVVGVRQHNIYATLGVVFECVRPKIPVKDVRACIHEKDHHRVSVLKVVLVYNDCLIGRGASRTN